MNEFKIIVIFLIIFGTVQTSHAQTNELVVSDEEKIILFTAFLNCSYLDILYF